MKKSTFIITALAFSMFACAQTPPKSITDNFNSRFNGVKHVKWNQEKDNEWEAEFKQNGNEISASFNNAGKWLETEIEISEKNLPDNVIESFNRSFKDYQIKEVEKIESADFSGFEIQIKKGNEKLEIQMSINGDIKTKKETNEVDDED